MILLFTGYHIIPTTSHHVASHFTSISHQVQQLVGTGTARAAAWQA